MDGTQREREWETRSWDGQEKRRRIIYYISFSTLNKKLYYKIIIFSDIFCDYVHYIVFENHNWHTVQTHTVT